MDLVEPIKERDVVDYDFMFVGGQKLAITLDPAAGDTLTEMGDRIEIRVTGKPSLSDPDEYVEPEQLTIYKQHMMVMVTCARKMALPTSEQKEQMKTFIHGLAKSVQ